MQKYLIGICLFLFTLAGRKTVQLAMCLLYHGNVRDLDCRKITLYGDNNHISIPKMYTDIEFTNDPNSRDTFQRTRLHYTVRLGNVNATRALLQAGADVNVVDVFGCTPLSVACVDKPSAAMVRLLLEHNADVNLERPGTIDLLLECVLNCTTPLQANIIKILVDRGIKINATDELSNRNCIHVVAMTGYLPLAEYLLKMGGIVNIRDNFNFTPMKIASVHEHFEVLKLMQFYLNKNYLT